MTYKKEADERLVKLSDINTDIFTKNKIAP